MRGIRRAPDSRNRKRARVRLIEALEARRLLATITVNTAVDTTNPNTTLSLRQAIEVSNGTLAVGSLTPTQQALVVGTVGASNTIDFLIPTSDPGFNAATGVWTIHVASELPAILGNAAIIDGYSQTGARQNTLAQADNAVLKIALDGTGDGGIAGLELDAVGSRVSGLDIGNFGFAGITVSAAGNEQVTGCFIGVNPTGEVAVPNGSGVAIFNSGNQIGGPAVGDRNIISGNTAVGSVGHGIYLPDAANNVPLLITPSSNLIENNFIGIDALGTTALGNRLQGVFDHGSDNTYGGTTAGLGNVISGNGSGGIQAAFSVVIEGNFIGTNATGTAALGNGAGGDGISNSDGGEAASTTITNNVVSGNHTGIFEFTLVPSSTYVIANNLIGTDVNGAVALGNSADGLQLNFIESALVLGNVISANNLGIALTGAGTDVENNTFRGNLIGTDIGGTIALGNTTGGILLSSAIGNVVGGPLVGQANIIAFNGVDGINVQEGSQNLITQNSIFGNAGPGIKLTSNGNLSQPAPVLAYNSGTGTLSGTLTATPSTTYTVEIFSNPTTPTAGQEQGKTFVQSIQVTTLASGVGTFSMAEPAAVYTATATDPNNNTSPFSNFAGQPVLPSTQTTVTSNHNPSTFGQSVTFTAIVVAQGVPVTPSGTVTFTIDGTPGSPVPLADVGGVFEALFTTTTLAAGSHTVSAAYGGDANLNPSSATLPTQVVNALPATTTTVTSNLNPSTFGQSVTFTAVVTPQIGEVTPTGSVTFTIDGTPGTPVPLADVGGVFEALFTTTTLAVGQHSVSAAYGGDTNLSPSSGTLPTQVVNLPSVENSTTTVTSSPNPSTFGQSVTFTAVVVSQGIPVTPTGTVTFTIDGQAEPAVPISVVGGDAQATFTLSTLAVGQHTVSAAYGGDANLNPSEGTLPTQVVNPATLPGTSTTLVSSANPSTFGQSVTFTAVVAELPQANPAVAHAALGVTPTGTVTFTIDGVAQPPVPLTALIGGGFAEALFTTSTLSVGQHSISAAYSGDANLSPSSGAVTQTIVAAPVFTAAVLHTAPNPSGSGQPVVLAAGVASADGSAVGGTITFVEGTTVLGVVPLGAGGLAVDVLSTLPVGSNSITAIYSGDATHSASASAAVVQVVAPPSVVAPTVLSLARFGFHAQPTTLVVGFSTALDAASARDVGNYQIVLLNRFGHPVRGRVIAVREAIYDPFTLSVTLVPAQRLDVHFRYQLTVNGTTPTGVRGATGLLLDGSGDGMAGSNYVAEINLKTLAGPAPGFTRITAAGRAQLAKAASALAFDRLAASGELATLAARHRRA